METEELVGAEQEEELCKKKWSQMHSFLQFENTRCVKNVSNTIYIPSYITYVIYRTCSFMYLFVLRFIYFFILYSIFFVNHMVCNMLYILYD